MYEDFDISTRSFEFQMEKKNFVRTYDTSKARVGLTTRFTADAAEFVCD